jgi:hypothetical protein
LSALYCADDQIIISEHEERKQAAHTLYKISLAYGITVSVVKKKYMAVKCREVLQ